MFGTYRFLLACLVLVTHLAGVRGAGAYAVFGFYLLSGYLMTLVLNERYGFSPNGFGRYVANRALRIYPPYLAILGFGVATIWFAPEVAARLRSTMILPDSADLWIRNIVIFGIGWDGPSRIIPPVWSLEAELILYLAMGLGLSRSKRIAAFWWLASVGYTAFLILSDAPWDARYYPATAASLAFATGANLYFHRDRVVAWIPEKAAIPLVVGFGLHALVASHIWPSFRMEGFYFSLVFGVCTQAALIPWSSRELDARWRTIDGVLGDLAYPVFLVHFHAGILGALVFAPGSGRVSSIASLILSVALALLVSFAVHQGVERPIEHLRRALRPQSSRR